MCFKVLLYFHSQLKHRPDKMKFYIILIILFTSLLHTIAQPFVNISTGLPPIGRSSVAFADFDNDHDLDLVMTGLDGSSNPLGKVFMNEQGVFVEVSSGITGQYNSSLAVCDFDLDGLKDIVITGQDFSGFMTNLYRNIGEGNFELIDAGFIAAGADGDVAWGDYDNDAWPDLLIAGGWNSILYHNDGDGTFSETDAGLTIMNTPSLDWGDCDNDGDLDILMVGDAGSVAETYIYLNNAGTFTRLDAMVEGTVGGSASWGDFDNDGNLDILITGKDLSLVPVSYVYRNNGDKTFSFANAGLIGTALGPADWIDYDSDGDLDIMLAGENAGCGNASTHIYTNNGVGSFDEYPAGLPFVERASSAWGDFDNDGDYDLLLTGLSGDPISILYRNDLLTGPFQQNSAPGIPGDLYNYVSGDYAVISWSRVTDVQSPQMAISYNVMVGSQSSGIDIVSPQADITDGTRFIGSPGNAGGNDFMVFRSLAPGDYFFRVQAIDQAFEGSLFSEEGSFTVLSTGIDAQDEASVKIYSTGTILRITGDEIIGSELMIFSVEGKKMWSGKISSDEFSYSLEAYPVGIYIVRLFQDNNTYNVKVVR
jgi:hypothetical protein